MKRTTFAILLFAGLLSAAETAPLKRDPPKEAVPPTPAQVKALGVQIDKLAKDIAKEQAAAPKAPAPAWPLPVLNLPASAHVATEISHNWTDAVPIPGAEGRVVYSFGAGLPVVKCAPFRVCVLELQAGEKLTSEPDIGDGVRWHISPRWSGSGATETWMVAIKPIDRGPLRTNLVINTDRRTYFLEIASDGVPRDDSEPRYVAHVSFSYPDAVSVQWKNAIDQQKASALAAAQVVDAPLERRGPENFNYKVVAKQKAAENFKPTRVYDQDGHTILKMPEKLSEGGDAPVLLIMGVNGKYEQTNYRVNGNEVMIDRVFDKAALVLGVGRQALRVEIVRQQKGA